MPTRELMPYVALRPRIEARRALEHAEQVAVGVGRLKEDDHRATIRRWAAAIAAGETTRPDAPDLAAAAQSAGIAFRTVSR